MLKLRPHHLLCILGFRGLGYSERFVENLRKVKDRYFQGENVEIVKGCDDICIECPFQSKGMCKLYGNGVLEIDREVAALLKLHFGDKLNSLDLLRRIAKLVDVDDMEKLCKGCPWKRLRYCIEGLLELKKEFKR